MSEGGLERRISARLNLDSVDSMILIRILDEARYRLEAIIAEIEKNATEDTLFERMVLHRLQTYCDIYFGTNLLDEALKKCAENRGEPK